MHQAPLQPTMTLKPSTVAFDTTSTPDVVVEATASATMATNTITPLPTLVTPTEVVVSLTPLPTLAADELESAIADLLTNPMNCDVPCWWGAVPGVTNLNEFEQNIAPYNFDVFEYSDEEGNDYFRLGIGYDEERNDFEVKIVYSFSNSILTGVTAFVPSISEFLVKYGQPNQVLLSAMNDPRQQPPLVWFILVYLQEGMGVGYVVDGHVQNDMLIGCVADENTERLKRLHLNTPNSTSYEDFSVVFDEERPYLPLEEATNLTIEGFMQLFSDSAQTHCIETLTELWD